MPDNCKALLKVAHAAGYRFECSYAIGYQVGHVEDGEEVHSVVLRLAGHRQRLAVVWASKRGQEKMGFDFGQILRDDGQGPLGIGYNEASALIRSTISEKSPARRKAKIPKSESP